MATKKVTKVTPAPVVTPTAAAAAALAPKKAAPRKKAVATAPKKAAPKKAVPKKAKPVATSDDLTMLHHEIRLEAYSYFIERGYRAGDPVTDWHRAEDAVLRRLSLR